MAIDTTPSVVATNALQALPFASLIGGPLDACIKAQAASAKTSWEFINEVGLYTDPKTGEKKAVQVTFQYNSNGQMTTLVVPLLTIVPIPYLAIDQVTIDFIANISASSSSVQENSSDKNLNVDATAEASIGVGPFSLKIDASANYSSKQHSASSQKSKYSVEYTMNVHVEGGQADMPQGLGTILNILQGSITSNSPKDMITASTGNIVINGNQGQTSSQFSVQIKDSHGVVVPSLKMTVTVTPNAGGTSPFMTPYTASDSTTVKTINARSVSGQHLFQHEQDLLVAFAQSVGDDNEIHTDTNGRANFRFAVETGLTGQHSGNIIISAQVPAPKGSKAPDTPVRLDIPYLVIIPQSPSPSPSPSMTLNPDTKLDFKPDGPKLQIITIKNSFKDVTKVTVTDSEGTDSQIDLVTDTANIKDNEGTFDVKVKAEAGITESSGTLTFTDNATTTNKVTLDYTIAAGDYN